MVNTVPKKQFVLLGGDILLIVLSIYLAPVLRFGVFPDWTALLDWPDVASIFIYLLGLYIFDFYNLEEKFRTAAYALRFLVAIVAADLFIATLFYAFNVRPYGSILFVFNTLLIFSFCLGWRLLHYQWDRTNRKIYRVMILGAGRAGSELQRMLARRDDFSVEGFLDDDAAKQGSRIGGVSVLGKTDLLKTFLDRIDLIVVAITGVLNQGLYRQLVKAKMQGVAVYEMPTFYERVLEKIPVRHVSDLWLVSVPMSGVRKSIYNQKIKKIFDKFLSLLGLLISLPIIFVTIVAIKLDSKGPIFYKQMRVGHKGRIFELIKFRSMRIDSEVNGAVWAEKNDPRVTRVGRLIRLLRFDEIPQFWNVLKGDMSLVGPRPERPEFVRELIEEIPYYSLRHAVAPGITGWAQVNYSYGASKEDALAKLEYDLYYIKNLSPLLDMLILARTVRTVLFGRGAR